MGQCLSTDRDYNTSGTAFKYPAYDWFGERKTKLKDTNQTSDKTREITDKESSGVAVAILARHGEQKEVVVFTANSKDNKSNNIAVTINMGQCTSAQTTDRSIEEEPYSVAPRARKRDEPYVYKSRYEPYSWDIYVDTAYNKPVRNRDKERSFTSLKWDFYVEPEQVPEKPEEEEPEETTYLDLHEPRTDKIPNGEITPNRSTERHQPDETHVKQPGKVWSKPVEEDSPVRVPSETEEVPKKRAKEEPARRPFWVTEGPTNKRPVDKESPTKVAVDTEDEPVVNFTPAKDQPRNTFAERTESPSEPVKRHSAPLAIPEGGREETSRKLPAVTTKQDDSVDDDTDDDSEEGDTDENGTFDEEIEEKYAPPSYKDVVPNTISVMQYDDVPVRVSEKQRSAPDYKDKQNLNKKPEKSEKPEQLNKPVKSGKVNISPELKRKEETPKDKEENISTPEKTISVQPVAPKHINGLVRSEKPVISKDKKACEPVTTKAVINPTPRDNDNLGTRPEKDLVKATVLIPNKFPQLFTGKRSAWRGLLLFGPAGSGKASLATAVAKEIGYSYCTLRTFMSLHSYNGNAISAMFKRARDNTPHVIIIDHLDGLSSVEIRELHKHMISSSEEQFEGLLVVGISDSPWLLDKSIIELFEKRIYITLPSAASRAELFRDNLEQAQHSLSEEDFIELGAWSEGYSCADIITVVNETLMRSLRKIQDATYFKKLNSKDPVTSQYVDLYTPCSPGEVGAIEMDWTRVPEKKLQEPVIRLSDVLVALRTQKPSLHPDDIEKHKQFAKKFTQHCQ